MIKIDVKLVKTYKRCEWCGDASVSEAGRPKFFHADTRFSLDVLSHYGRTEENRENSPEWESGGRERKSFRKASWAPSEAPKEGEWCAALRLPGDARDRGLCISTLHKHSTE